MQLKKRNGRSAVQPIGAPLAAATCALLGSGISDEVKAQELGPWDVDTSLLVYSEDNSRVQDLSFNVLARKELREESFLNLTLALDTLRAHTTHAEDADFLGLGARLTCRSGRARRSALVTRLAVDRCLEILALDTAVAAAANHRREIDT